MFGRMTLDRIQRVDLDAAWSEAQKQASHAVAQQAATLLGYKHFTQLVSMSNYKNQLHEALRELGIRPFDQADVQAYKERMTAKHTQGNTIASWIRTKLPQYNGIVPEFALQTALDIKAKLPTAEFEVDWMHARVYDPFLIVCLGGEYAGHREWLEVWNEAEFKAARRV